MFKPPRLPDVCKSAHYDWNPIEASGRWSALFAVLAAFVFAAIIMVLSNPPETPQRKAEARALKLLFTAFFSLVVCAYLAASLSGEQVCPRAEMEQLLIGGIFGAAVIIMIVALTWLLLVYNQVVEEVLGFLRCLIYFALVFASLMLAVSSIGYITVTLRGAETFSNDLMWASLPLAIVIGVLRVVLDSKAAPVKEEIADTRVNRLAWSGLIYLTIAAFATGYAVSVPAKDWYPTDHRVVYVAGWCTWLLPLVVLWFAARAVARTPRPRRSS